MTSIGEAAFNHCDNLNEIIIPATLKNVGNYAFSACGGKIVINCEIPDVLTSDERWFKSALFTEVEIGENVKKIGKYAFYEMLSLTKISLGRNVSKIGSYAFTGCSNLSEMYCNSATPPVCASTAFDEDTKLFCDVFVPEGSLAQYQSENQWKEFCENKDIKTTFQ